MPPIERALVPTFWTPDPSMVPVAAVAVAGRTPFTEHYDPDTGQALGYLSFSNRVSRHNWQELQKESLNSAGQLRMC